MDKSKKPRKVQAEFGITNDFMFWSLMSDNGLCLELLRRVLPEKHIVSVKTQGQREIKGSLDSKGIRLDVLATDDKGRHYDIEMQVWDKFLGRRLRYYRAKIDEYSLLAGQSYRDLPETYIIIFSPFDQFGEKRRLYRCADYNLDTGKVIDTGVTTIFVNSRGEKGRVSKKLQNFLDLMNDKVVDGDNYIKQLKDKMLMYNNDSEWRRINMDLKMKMDDARYIGRKEGEKLGRKEGERLGQRKSTLSAIQKVMSALKVTADQAMDILDIPESDRAGYKSELSRKA